MTTTQDEPVVEDETVTVTWDGDEWTVPALAELTGDQHIAVERWVERSNSGACLHLLEVLLGRQQFAALGLSGASKHVEIVNVTVEFMAEVSEAWGMRPNRATRRATRGGKG